MSLHKLTAGDGYTYLTRQVAVQDATDRGTSGLADYYSEKGESPGRWWGSGLCGVDLERGDTVTEAQMKSLLGEGRHPDAAATRVRLIEGGAAVAEAEQATRLGRPFRIASGATEFAKRVAESYVEYNLSRGKVWSTAIEAPARAAIRTRVAEEMFRERYGRGPLDARERHGFVAQESRQRTTSVAGFDLSFTPVKSVSTLWAIADLDVAREIEAAHAAAVQDTLAWLEREVLFTRHGHRGVRQVRTRGLIASVFTHRDSRAGDPNLHTHVAVSNKVQAESGAWLAIDARVLFKAGVTLSEHYNTRLEAELHERLRLRFAESPDRARGRPVREVAGIDPRLIRSWSRRRRAIDGRRTELAQAFQHDHGRPPTPTESIALSQQANLETREAKHAPRSEKEQRQAWATEAAEVLGSRSAVRQMVSDCLPDRLQRSKSPGVTEQWLALTAARVVQTVEADRATWQTWHLRAEAHRQARYAGVPLAELGPMIEDVVRQAIDQHCVPLPDPDPTHSKDLTPPALRRPGNSPAYVVHGTRRFTSQTILDAENVILNEAGRNDGPVIAPDRIRDYLAGRRGRLDRHELTHEQQQLVARLTGASQRLQVALAPAGTGKTTSMQAVAELWLSQGHRVVGLAPSAAAAHQLQEALDPSASSTPTTQAEPTAIPCDTLAKLAHGISHPGSMPGWAAEVDASTLVIVDEAAMAGTIELAAVVGYVSDRGGCVRLVGDDRQLSAVAAGGIIRDIADRYGAATLGETRRFTDPVEGVVTLALRDGDPAALGFYTDHDRLHVGDQASCTEQAYKAWQNDLAVGRTSVLIAPTRELVGDLNSRAQRDRLTREGERTDRSGELQVADGTTLHVGDLVITRRNDRRLTTSATDWVKNGDRWTVTSIHPDGSAKVRHLQHRCTVTLPADYVAHHLDLGYATTVHGAQGLTVDTAHAVLTGDEDRSLLYVALSRGRDANHAYVSVLPHAGSPTSETTTWHDLVTRPEVQAPPTAVEVLATALAREPQSESASSALGSAPDSLTTLHDLLQTAADRYRDALLVAAETDHDSDALQRLTSAANRLPGLVDEPAWEALRANLLLASIDHPTDPAELLRDLLDGPSLAGARDTAAVLSLRLEQHQLRHPSTGTRDAPLPWLPRIPDVIAADPTWSDYLSERSAWVSDLVLRMSHAADIPAGPHDRRNRPAWMRSVDESEDATLLGDLAIWRAVEGIDPTDLTPAGAVSRPGRPGRHQAGLARRAEAASRSGDSDTEHSQLPQAVLSDPWLPHLLQRLRSMPTPEQQVQPDLHSLAGADNPLPTETPASALWWRLQSQAQSTNTPPEPDHHQDVVDLGPDPRWAVDSDTTYARIVELHRLAQTYYAGMYRRSWAPQYLTGRLYEGWEEHASGTPPGYAPPGPHSLVQHLRATGATDTELLDAGLAWKRERPHGAFELVDTFRDRVLFPLHDPLHPGRVVGFVGRRNPTKDKTQRNGPKYLNTRTTAAYAKSTTLFGLGELSGIPGCAIALAEGPADALAITLATRGQVVGLATLGTALTNAQVELLVHQQGQDRRPVLLAYDSDAAGDEAAERAAARLAREGIDARRIALPAGSDPSQVLTDAGAAELRRSVSEAALPGLVIARPHTTPVIDDQLRRAVTHSTTPTTSPRR